MALDMGRYAPPISCAPKHRCVSMQPICCNRCMYGRQVFTKRHNHCACVPSAVTIARTASRRNPSAVRNHCTYEHSIGHHQTAVATSMAEDTNKNNTSLTSYLAGPRKSRGRPATKQFTRKISGKKLLQAVTPNPSL
jgi:hypothetical protein